MLLRHLWLHPHVWLLRYHWLHPHVWLQFWSYPTELLNQVPLVLLVLVSAASLLQYGRPQRRLQCGRPQRRHENVRALLVDRCILLPNFKNGPLHEVREVWLDVVRVLRS